MYAQTVMMNTAKDLMRVFAFVFARLISRVFSPSLFGKDRGRGGDYLLVCDSSVVLCFPRKERVERMKERVE